MVLLDTDYLHAIGLTDSIQHVTWPCTDMAMPPPVKTGNVIPEMVECLR